ncbi:MAG TPA: cystatin domain-containing protein [Gammaproteobacteria bacterium]|nr:cystatin domain-containing protein [Gammaproteobacteria bacterium]
MLKRILFLATFTFCTIAYADDAMTPSTTTTTTTTATTQPVAKPDVLPGGYADISVNDKGVVDAANFATQQLSQGTLTKIVSAQAQVVAGMNYKMQLILTLNGVDSLFNVTVFVPLPNSGQDKQLSDMQAMGAVDNTDADASTMTTTTTTTSSKPN